jgi:NADH-quinone oxidoreductase subunit C
MTNLDATLRQAFRERTGAEIPVLWRRDRKGVPTGWCRIEDPALLLPLAEAVAAVDGRLSMITASRYDNSPQRRELLYHFDLDGATLTITVSLPLTGAELPSLTPLFRSADWHERELMELYDVAVTGHPDPRPLFIDKAAGSKPLERLVPYSSFTNGAASRNLWEQVMAAQAAKEKA